MKHDRAILLTAPGAAAIAVVRIMGPGAADFLARHFSGRVTPGRAVHGRLRDGDREIDDPLVMYDPARQVADICTHGGTWVVQSLLDVARREGFDTQEPTLPLPPIATDTEDLLQQEILSYLPLARTREAIATLLNQESAWQEAQTFTKAQRQSIKEDRSLYWLLHCPRVAIIGVPNAGKSTLANAMFAQQRSIVADAPGTTRDYVEEYANLGGLPVRLVDTPGLRITSDSIEAAAIGVSLSAIESADLLILLLDPTQAPEPQRALADKYPSALRVSGKSDIAAPVDGQAISAATGAGLGMLQALVRQHFGCETLPHARPCLWTDSQRLRFSW